MGTGAHVLVTAASADPVGPRTPTAAVLSATAERSQGALVGASELRSRVEAAVLRADVEACGKVRQGTVTMVRTAGGVSGFTNSHVARGAMTLTLSGAGLGVADVPVGEHLVGRDVARVVLDPLEPPPDAALDVGGAVVAGDEVTTAGFPEGRWRVQKGRVVSVGPHAGWGGSGVVMVIDVPALEGTSGGVVVDRSGRAVGLIVARDPRSGYTLAYPMSDVLTRAPGADAGC